MASHLPDGSAGQPGTRRGDPSVPVSVVVNTFNRAASLRSTLEGLSLLDYPTFEVVVVNGPSTDATSSVLDEWRDSVKILRTDERNLSVSRNLGIAAAAGDIVAFIDDDAYPDPQWLDRLVAAYGEDEVAGAGGPVYDHTGYDFQIFYNSGNRFGDSWNGWPKSYDPTPLLNRPHGDAYPSLLGANASFRRDRLVEIGGFDEEFEYFLDETDVCVRLVDRGYVLRMTADAFVYHKFLQSHVRNDRRVLRDRYPIIKNHFYFATKHALVSASFYDVVQDMQRFVDTHRAECREAVARGDLAPEDLGRFEADVHRAYDAVHALLSDRRARTRPAAWFAERRLPFLRFPTRLPAADKLHVALFSQEYPPGVVGGIARFTREAAVGLAELGHDVHVLTRGTARPTVDLEDGVWVHRLPPEPQRAPAEPEVPQPIWDYSATLAAELRRIDAHRRLDLVELPLWDSEGVAVIRDGTIPTVVSLHTPLPTALALNPHWAADAAHREGHIRPLLALERFCLDRCDFIRANSRAVVDEIERGHFIRLDRARLATVPHGVGAALPAPGAMSARGGVEVLFVGRLERRKGVDVLLEAMVPLLRELPGLRLALVGDDMLPGPDGRSYRVAFEAAHRGLVRAGRVRFAGAVAEPALEAAYAGCDLVVVPSRYESFGLVLLEAMRHGKPCVASDVGGMPEVVVAEETGLLVPPGDAGALAAAIRRLADDPALRERLGRRAAEVYAATFTRAAMARRAVAVYRGFLARGRADGDPAGRDVVQLPHRAGGSGAPAAPSRVIAL